MHRSLVKRLKKNNGAALAFVIIVLAVVTIFSLIVANLVLGNLTQAKTQERQIQAYYIAQSGTDLCMSALLQQGPGGANDTLLYQKFNPTIASPGTLSDSLVLTGGVVNLTVSATLINGDRWIVIQSVATLDGSSTTGTTTLEFQYSDPLVQKKS